jgi:cytochrome c oxidase assembly factor CtaG
VDTFTGVILMQGTHAVMLLPSQLNVDALSDTRTGGAIMWFGGDAVMAAVMITLVIGWLRAADASAAAGSADEKSWLEQARRATFTEHTGADSGATIDSDEHARQSYNDWLAQLSRER